MIWLCRSLDPRNKLALIRRKVAEVALLPVDHIYFTNLAKCGSRGAYGESDGGKLADRIEHCEAYLVEELVDTGTWWMPAPIPQ